MVEPGDCNGPTCPSPLNSVLAVPLQTDSGTIGVLALYRAAKDAFSREDMQDLMVVSSRISLAIENSWLQEHWKILRNVDVITGLPNGGTLSSNIEAEIGKRRASNATLTVLLCAFGRGRRRSRILRKSCG
jgi:GAF domain-containing protein